MSLGRPPPGSIPTLTEVVTWPATTSSTAPLPAPVPAPVPVPVPAQATAPPPPAVVAATSEAELMQRVMSDLQRQVDLMLEVRLREALAPALVRATDTLAREARKELTAALKDIVAQAVARELGRSGQR